jgi:anti-anti-sigma factor
MTLFDRPQLFSLAVERDRQTAVFTLRGELDISETYTLAEALLAAEREEPQRLVIDLAELTFIDAAGMRVLVEAARRANSRRVPVMFVEPLPEIRRILELVGLDLVATLGVRSDRPDTARAAQANA